MKVNTTSSFISAKNIELFEKEYAAKYVFETCLKARDGGWANFPAAVFYTEKAHPQGSNYFAVYHNGDTLMITDALPSIKDVVFTGLEAEGEVVYSRYRHDYREGKNGVFVDGGRDYLRYGGDAFNDYNIVKFKVVEDHLEFIK
ncbi:hypothetical protein UFOVP247_151 [uncultured Caudovirales phage]|uniref:Uncharacterized protein n=1 Tax=uncultured Caudovirales phage TaxID=2100421 RepID=A0A6J7WUC8_9CAUD|nr:hypothetical protein UFOVP247_151 [uncultured Caudovirales phage]